MIYGLLSAKKFVIKAASMGQGDAAAVLAGRAAQFGTVVRCETDGVDVRWDDGQLGELIWDDSVAYSAFSLQIIRTAK